MQPMVQNWLFCTMLDVRIHLNSADFKTVLGMSSDYDAYEVISKFH